MARVFLANPDIIFVDEATSALDLRKEAALQQNMRDVSGVKTTLFIT
jgi:ABC-type transport system involved in Fe-S cluster assembly fused permease/ATPase subunit